MEGITEAHLSVDRNMVNKAIRIFNSCNYKIDNLIRFY